MSKQSVLNSERNFPQVHDLQEFLLKTVLDSSL